MAFLILHPVCRTLRGHALKLVAAAFLVTVAVCHGAILRRAAKSLVVEHPPRKSHWIVVWGGDRSFERAADYIGRGWAAQVLLIRLAERRLVRLRILPSDVETARRELVGRGVPAASIHIVRGAARHEVEAARRLANWINQHPHATVRVLCARFDSSRKLGILARQLGPDGRKRVTFEALPDRRFDETNWWRSRDGLKGFFNAALEAAYIWARGDQVALGPEWDPDAYERGLP